jgi:hypothetical protein
MQVSLPSLPVGARVALVGSRSFAAAAVVQSVVAALPPGCVVVSGGARGADSLAAAAAAAAGLQLQVFAAEWGRYGLGAGPVRNAALVASGLQLLVCFLSSPGCPSPGSRSVMSLARAAGVPVLVFGPAGPVN